MIENRLKKGLGRGLSSLLGDSSKKIETNKVLIKDLTRNKFQPRRQFVKESLEELTNSIKEQGVIQPIVVRPDKSAGKYELEWDGTDRFGKQVSTGVYLTIMQTRNFSQARKIMYIK